MKNKVLIVDDDKRNLRILEEILSDDYDLEKCLSGEETIEHLKVQVPDLILLDIMMPGLDGYQVTEYVRSQESLKNLKIILVSGRAMTEDRLRGYEAGANDFISKPFDHDELEAKVKNYIDLYNAEKSLKYLNEKLESEIELKTNEWIKNEKMALIGMHAAELVHNLNNPLTVLLTTVGSLNEGEVINLKMLDRLNRSTEKIKTIVSSVLDSARNTSNITKQAIELNSLIKSELEMTKLNVNNFKCELELREIPTFDAIPSHIIQIVNNLVQNAIDAMHKSTTKILKLSTWSDESDIYLSVEDSGSGIPEQIREKIFNPMFTTKSTSASGSEPQGTGLGLASVKRMVESYNGKIFLDSQLNVGTKFTLTFPFENDQNFKMAS